MRTPAILLGLLLAAAPLAASAGEPLPLYSPGFAPSHLDDQGRLVEDWGTLGVRLGGEKIVAGPTTLEAIRLDDLIPAVRASSQRGAVRLVLTAYRAPVFPAGLDVLGVRVEETQGQAATVSLGLDLPDKAHVGLRNVTLRGRVLLVLPAEAAAQQELREWGSCDDATSHPGWAKPAVACDPAFRNIRAGMGGAPIEYQFTVAPKSAATVVLGFCESHWAQAGQRPLVCRVEGAPPQTVDPVTQWGQHQPGALVFQARDENGDGKLQVRVQGVPGAKDRNPILNAIWIFPPGAAPELAQVVSGAKSDSALRYVDCGGENDQTIRAPDKVEYQFALPAGGAKEFVFLAACPAGSLPPGDLDCWTPNTLRRAAAAVWRDWPQP